MNTYESKEIQMLKETIKRLEEENRNLENLAYHDPLTGLYNRTGGIKKMEAVNAEEGYVMLAFDLDNFKSANDIYGHQFGDEILVYVANALRSCSRENDITLRMGGDEFVMLLKEQDDEELNARMNVIINTIAVQYKDYKIGTSIGVSKFNGSYEESLKKADEALYKVKRGKKNSWCMYV